jgi:phosphatidate cytidylyltransferase
VDHVTDTHDLPDSADGDAVVTSTGAMPGRPSAGRNLPVATAVGLALGALFLGSLFYHPAAFAAMVLLTTLLAVWETGTVLSTVNHVVARPVLLMACFVMAVATYLLGAEGQTLGLLVLVLGAFGWDLATVPRTDVVHKLGTTVFLGMWIIFLSSFAILLVDRETGGAAAVLAVGGGAIFGDTGGYAFGRLFGKHAIAPTVSPNKTWEGLVGGLVTSGVLGFFVLPMVDATLFAQPLDGAIVAMVAALAGFFGDLAESMVKRDVGLKDLGTSIPGHGGVLDRIDGLLLAFPVGYYVLELVT